MTDLNALGGKKLRADLLAKSGYVIFAIVLLFNIAFRAFAHAGISWQTVWRFTADCVLYVSSVYVAFCALADTARRDAMAKDAYLASLEKCRLACEAAKENRHLLSAYCISYALKDKEERKREYLGLCGIAEADYDAYYAKKSKKELKALGLFSWQVRLLKKAEKVKPMKIDRASLFEMGERKKAGRLFVNPRTSRVRRYSASLLPTTLFALFSAQIVFVVSANEDIRTLFLELLLRTALLSFTAVRGYAVGEKTILSDTVSYLEAKAEFLEQFVLDSKET